MEHPAIRRVTFVERVFTESASDPAKAVTLLTGLADAFRAHASRASVEHPVWHQICGDVSLEQLEDYQTYGAFCDEVARHLTGTLVLRPLTSSELFVDDAKVYMRMDQILSIVGAAPTGTFQSGFGNPYENEEDETLAERAEYRGANAELAQRWRNVFFAADTVEGLRVDGILKYMSYLLDEVPEACAQTDVALDRALGPNTRQVPGPNKGRTLQLYVNNLSEHILLIYALWRRGWHLIIDTLLKERFHVDLLDLFNDDSNASNALKILVPNDAIKYAERGDEPPKASLKASLDLLNKLNAKAEVITSRIATFLSNQNSVPPAHPPALDAAVDAIFTSIPDIVRSEHNITRKDVSVEWRAYTRLSDFKQALLDADRLLVDDVAQSSLSGLGARMAPELLAQQLAQRAETLVRQLSEAPTVEARKMALQQFGTLPPVELAKHAAGVLAAFQNDPDPDVWRAVLRMLGKLPPEELEKHKTAIAARLDPTAATRVDKASAAKVAATKKADAAAKLAELARAKAADTADAAASAAAKLAEAKAAAKLVPVAAKDAAAAEVAAAEEAAKNAAAEALVAAREARTNATAKLTGPGGMEARANAAAKLTVAEEAANAAAKLAVVAGAAKDAAAAEVAVKDATAEATAAEGAAKDAAAAANEAAAAEEAAILQMMTLALLRRLPHDRLSPDVRTTVARHDPEYSPGIQEDPRAIAPRGTPSHPIAPSQRAPGRWRSAGAAGAARAAGAAAGAAGAAARAAGAAAGAAGAAAGAALPRAPSAWKDTRLSDFESRVKVVEKIFEYWLRDRLCARRRLKDEYLLGGVLRSGRRVIWDLEPPSELPRPSSPLPSSASPPNLPSPPTVPSPARELPRPPPSPRPQSPDPPSPRPQIPGPPTLPPPPPLPPQPPMVPGPLRDAFQMVCEDAGCLPSFCAKSHDDARLYCDGWSRAEVTVRLKRSEVDKYEPQTVIDALNGAFGATNGTWERQIYVVDDADDTYQYTTGHPLVLFWVAMRPLTTEFRLVNPTMTAGLLLLCVAVCMLAYLLQTQRVAAPQNYAELWSLLWKHISKRELYGLLQDAGTFRTWVARDAHWIATSVAQIAGSYANSFYHEFEQNLQNFKGNYLSTSRAELMVDRLQQAREGSRVVDLQKHSA